MIRPVLRMGDPRLLQVAKKVSQFGTPELAELLQDMRDTMVHLNGAGLVYFARYESMMNYGERKFFGRQLEVPVSNEFVSCLSTEHRKAYFFANASPGDDVDVRISAELLPPGAFPEPPASRPHRTPMKFRFRLELYRSSDNVLMATSLVRKALNVPGPAKAVLMESERLLRRWT